MRGDKQPVPPAFLHKLRNVLGPIEIDAELARALIRRGDAQGAEEVLAKLVDAVQRARALAHEATLDEPHDAP